MTRAVVLRRAAQREFDDAALWYEERRRGLGTAMFAVFGRVASPTRYSSEWNRPESWCSLYSTRVEAPPFGIAAHSKRTQRARTVATSARAGNSCRPPARARGSSRS